MSDHYLIALGSNIYTAQWGPPERVLEAAFAQLDRGPLDLIAQSGIIQSKPIGPSRRRYANAAAIVDASLSPPALLAHLKQIEQAFGKRRGQRWAARALDLDIILWSGGCFSDAALNIPHIAFRQRDFVLKPACRIAPEWRDPISGNTIRQLRYREYRARMLHRPNLSPRT